MTRDLLTSAFDTLSWMRKSFNAEQESIYNYYNLLGDISIRIVDYRKEHSLSQTQLAEKLGITQTMVSRYESGEYNFSIKSLNDLCSKLDLSLGIHMDEINAATANNHLQEFVYNDDDDIIAA